MRTLRRIWRDIRRGQHIEVYIVTAVGVTVSVLGILGGIPLEQQMAVAIAALTLLVFNISSPTKLEGSLDDFLNDRDAFPPLRERLQQAQTLEVFAPSAINLLSADNLHIILETVLAHKEGLLRVVILDKRSADGMAVAKRQLDDAVDIQVQVLEEAVVSCQRQFEVIRRNMKQGTFEYGFLDYNPGFSMVVINGDKPSGVIILEIHGFKNISTRKRMNIEIRRSTSETWYNYWLGQIRSIWQAAQKPN